MNVLKVNMMMESVSSAKTVIKFAKLVYIKKAIVYLVKELKS